MPPARRLDGVSSAQTTDQRAPARLRYRSWRTRGPLFSLVFAKKGVEFGYADAFWTVLGKALEPAGGPQAPAFGFERFQI